MATARRKGWWGCAITRLAEVVGFDAFAEHHGAINACCTDTEAILAEF